MASTLPEENPLISALPPATDYMTYLTLLEYQLTPQNIPTLSALLSSDDGKLAEEIGWDLLKLVLPMLHEAPAEANRCLEIVARRGNPREVVVRVAEELEKLGDQNEDLEDDHEQDDLPTFPGEAPRVHLGEMALEGMPDSNQSAENPAVHELPKGAQLQALLNMLGILHPRIKTQYPSRFLATSLPAALGAYRSIPITTETTATFLNMLEKLADRKRPPLPPRGSTQGAPQSSVDPAPALPTPATSRPDPEAGAEAEATGTSAPSDGEKAIIFRLLDAVLLEVLDEYMSALATQEYPSMSWTARLRESLEPKRVVPGRPTETDLWKRISDLQGRDTLLAQFYSICKEMQVDTSHEIRALIHEDGDGSTEDPHHEKEPSEYPTSPSQIPFPRAGVIYLHAYRSYLDPSDTTTLLTTTELTKLIAHSFPLSATPAIPLPALQDSLLSLLYRQTLAVAAAPTSPQPSPAKFRLLLSTITQLFTITPYPSLRDSAYYLATKLLHGYPDPSVRMRVIMQTLQGSTLSTNWAEIEDEELETGQPPEPEIVEETGLTRSTSALIPHPIPLSTPQQLGQLKAIGVDWLKAEFATWIAANPPKSDGGSVPVVIGALDPITALLVADTQTPADEGKRVEDAKPTLLDLVLPSDIPILSSTSSAADTPDSDPFSEFFSSIRFFISTLNLICIILPHLSSDSSSSSASSSGGAAATEIDNAPSTLKARISAHIDSLAQSSTFLLGVLEHAQSSTAASSADDGEAEQAALEESRADIFALEDACARAKEAWEKL